MKPQLFGIQTDKTSGENVLYGYKVSTPVMYYFFLFTVGLFFATSGIFWTRFLLKSPTDATRKMMIQIVSLQKMEVLLLTALWLMAYILCATNLFSLSMKHSLLLLVYLLLVLVCPLQLLI